VIIGDHLAMKNAVYDKLTSVDQRYIFNMIVSKNKLSKNTEEIVPFDMLPTMITLLGFDIEGGRLGLGYSAVGSAAPRRSEKGIAEMKDKISWSSEVYNRLWQL
jgi:phosphoglycerol transferase